MENTVVFTHSYFSIIHCIFCKCFRCIRFKYRITQWAMLSRAEESEMYGIVWRRESASRLFRRQNIKVNQSIYNQSVHRPSGILPKSRLKSKVTRLTDRLIFIASMADGSSTVSFIISNLLNSDSDPPSLQTHDTEQINMYTSLYRKRNPKPFRMIVFEIALWIEYNIPDWTKNKATMKQGSQIYLHFGCLVPPKEVVVRILYIARIFRTHSLSLRQTTVDFSLWSIVVRQQDVCGEWD